MKGKTRKTITLFLSLLIFLSCGSQTQEKKVDFDLQEMSSVPLDGMMKEKDRVRDELFELLKIYYNGSFLPMVCDYIRTTGMTP